MQLFRLAFRNLWRNPRRTGITLAAVVVGLGIMILMITLQSGQYRDMIRAAVGSQAGHVVVQAEGYQEDKDAELVVTDVAAIEARLAEAFPDATVASRIRLGGLLTSTTGSVGGAVMGVQPEAEARVQDLPREQIVEGEWLADDDDRGIVLGAKMAETLGVELGDKVVYMGQHGDAEEMASRMFRVRGLFRTGADPIDGFLAYTHLSATQELLGQEDVAHMVTLHLAHPDEAGPAAETAAGLLGEREGLDVLPWREALPELYGLIEIDRVSGDVMLAILGLIVAMGVLNTVLMSALERTREFGVMLAVGMKPRRLAALVLAEGTVLGVIGAGLGLGFGLLISWPLVVYGIDYSAFMGAETFESAGIAISTLMKGQINPVRTGWYVVMAVVFTTLAAVYPAVYVSRLEPVDAMHHA